MVTQKLWWGAAVLMVAQAWPLAGVSAPSDNRLPQPLHLSQALRQALENNLTLRQARQQVGVR